MNVQGIKKACLFLLFLFVLTVYPVFVYSENESTDMSSAGESIRGLVKPVQAAILSSEIPATIISMPFQAGESFKMGDVLVGFDCNMNQANLAAARAEYEARSKKNENNQQLLKLNAISNIEVEISAAEVKKAAAEVRINQIRVERCQIKAPYNGRVIDTLANEFESVETDTDLLSILNDNQLEIELIIPSSWLGWLKIGDQFEFKVDETGQTYPATVSRIGAAVDAISQTIRVIGVFTSVNEDILSGMSGTATFGNTSAHQNQQ